MSLGVTRGRGFIVALAVLWVAGVLAGARYLLRYEKTPGREASAPVRWPKGVAETGEAGLPTLVVALHPRCSCSRASLSELERAAQGFRMPFNALLLIYQPVSGGSDWQNNALYRDAQRNLHAQVVPDTGGALASKFGAETSGEVILYSRQERSGQRTLLYAGGVTGARGMDGANAGADELVQAFEEQRKQAGRPVYGCGLSTFGGAR